MLVRLGPLPAGPVDRILFVTATRIGDAVLSTGLLSHLLDRYPDSRVTIVAGPVAAPLFIAVPRLERLIALAKRSHSRHWLDLYAQIAMTRWDLVVDLRGSALSWLLWTRHRRVIAKGDPTEHRVVQLARLFDLSTPPAPHLWTLAGDEAAADLGAVRTAHDDGGSVSPNWRSASHHPAASSPGPVSRSSARPASARSPTRFWPPCRLSGGSIWSGQARSRSSPHASNAAPCSSATIPA